MNGIPLLYVVRQAHHERVSILFSPLRFILQAQDHLHRQRRYFLNDIPLEEARERFFGAFQQAGACRPCLKRLSLWLKRRAGLPHDLSGR